jgi:AAHS family 4-hydroxybenzoate transporter-like MFS transporter
VILGRLLDRTFSFWVLAGCYAWAAAFVYAIGHTGGSVALLALTISCAGVGIIGGQNASHALSSEFYPTRIRSTGVGWALGIGRIGSIVGPLVGGLLLSQSTPMRDVFWAAVIPALAATLAAAGIAHAARNATPTRV